MIASSLMLAVPALAETTTSVANTIASPTLLSCVASAVATRESSMSSAFATYSSSVSSALSARASALASAWTLAERTPRNSAIKSAWTAYENSYKQARNNLKASKETSWSNFNTAKKACKTANAQ